MKLTASPDLPFEGDVDLAEVLAALPDNVTVRGMFLSRYRKATTAAWSTIAPELRAPPKDGRYEALERYPIQDYQVLLDFAARERGLRSTREAYRLLGRGEVEVFADSTLGKVALSFIKDPATALTRYPEVLAFVADGISGYATSKGRSATIVFPRFVGAIESTIGTLEGIAMAMGAKPTVEMEVEWPRVGFVVTW